MVSVYGLGTQIPIYVTRKTSKGETGSYSLSCWMPLLVMILAFLNAVAWGVLGLVFAVRVIV